MNIVEIYEKFPTEAEAVAFFEQHRWGESPKCAYCKGTKLSKRTKDHRFKCYDCNRTSSVTVDTLLHNTRLPLQKWLLAFSIITDAKKGLSALQLQRNLDISYPTSFKMYHVIRTIMAVNNANKIIELDGIVEADETYVGGKPRRGVPRTAEDRPMINRKYKPELDEQIDELEDKGFDFTPQGHNPAKIHTDVKSGRGTKKIPVVGIVQRDGDVVAQVMRTLSGDNLKAMVQKYVDEDDSVIITDEYPGYNKLDKIIEHIKVDHEKIYSYRGVNTNTIESFWAIIKRGIIGQYHQVSPKYLPNYVAEFVFKYNNRKDDTMFITLVKNAMRRKEVFEKEK